MCKPSFLLRFSPKKGSAQSQDSPEFSQKIISHPVSLAWVLSSLVHATSGSLDQSNFGQDVASDHWLVLPPTTSCLGMGMLEN